MQRLTYEKIEEISLIRLDDGKANAMGPEMIKELNEAIDKAEEESRALLITGRPGLLSGGFDLTIIRSGDNDAIRSMVKSGAKLLMRIYGFPKPLVMATSGHGVALGGFLLLAADYRFGASGDFKIGLNEVAIGMTLPPFALMLAKARIANQFLTNSAINANMFNPETAKLAGFLDEVSNPSELLSNSIDKTKELATLDLSAFKQTKNDFRSADIQRILANLEAQ
ncbi:crotonase/enoyl-CoA hydratase family protein [Gammaproteobacteria bacterium]|nr:crotonase/enoyl-CoA hydratase family protein [Gammaproteobacteria bacterium]